MDKKETISPIQRWLLSQGRCLSCGRYLESEVKNSKREKVQCECGRTFIWEDNFEPYTDFVYQRSK